MFILAINEISGILDRCKNFNHSFNIYLNMFKDEILKKFNMEELCDYQVVFFGNGRVALSGIKGVTYLSDVEIRFKTKTKVLLLKGKNLFLIETGGTEAYVEGEVLSFEIV